MADTNLNRHVADVRAFNRFYTRQMGLLQDGLLKSPFSLTEARVLYELAHRTAPTAGKPPVGRSLTARVRRRRAPTSVRPGRAILSRTSDQA